MSKSIHAICPKCNHEFLFKTKAKRPRPHCPECNNWFYIPEQNTQNTQKKKIIKKVQNSANFDTSIFIDDPDELLMSVAVRELNKSNPDPRWANVLITTRKENIGQSTKEGKIRSRFKSMNIKNIAKILSGKPLDTSQKQDLEENS